MINDQVVQNDQNIYIDHLIKLPQDCLKAGERNYVKVYFLSKYRVDGVGLHTFV